MLSQLRNVVDEIMSCVCHFCPQILFVCKVDALSCHCLCSCGCATDSSRYRTHGEGLLVAIGRQCRCVYVCVRVCMRVCV